MKKRQVKTYTEEFKKSSAQLAFSGEQPISQTAKELGINVNTLHTWVGKYFPKTLKESVQSSEADIMEELKQVKKENIRLKQERDILKKAAAYFASEMS